jgi:hypothetical protein
VLGALSERRLLQHPLQRTEDVVAGAAVRVDGQAHAEVLTAHRLVVAVHPQRADDHRLAEVQALVEAVATAVGQEHLHVRVGEHVELGGHPALDAHVLGQRLVGQQALLLLGQFPQDVVVLAEPPCHRQHVAYLAGGQAGGGAQADEDHGVARGQPPADVLVLGRLGQRRDQRAHHPHVARRAERVVQLGQRPVHHQLGAFDLGQETPRLRIDAQLLAGSLVLLEDPRHGRTQEDRHGTHTEEPVLDPLPQRHVHGQARVRYGEVGAGVRLGEGGVRGHVVARQEGGDEHVRDPAGDRDVDGIRGEALDDHQRGFQLLDEVEEPPVLVDVQRGVVGVADHGGVRGEPLRARDLGVDVLVPRQGRQLRHHVPE